MVEAIKKWLKKGSEPKPEFCEAVAKVGEKVRRNKMKTAKKVATVTAGACVLVAAGGCAHVKNWLADGPSITLSAGVGPANVSIALNPGRTIVTAAETVTDAVASALPTTGEVAPLPSPVAPETVTR